MVLLVLFKVKVQRHWIGLISFQFFNFYLRHFMSLSYSYTTFELSLSAGIAFCRFLVNNVVKTSHYLCAENLPIRTLSSDYFD